MEEREWPSAVITAVRVRPMSEDERKAGCRSIIFMEGNQTRIIDPAGLSPTASSYRRQPSPLKSSASSPMKPSRSTMSSEAKAKMWSQSFAYDFSFWSCHTDHSDHADQQYVYDSIGTKMVGNAWNGLNTSLFAYGQTGAGKSFSMMGKQKSNHRDLRGLIPRICQGLFDTIESRKSESDARCTVKMSFVEIYNERVYDLLHTQSKEALKVREHPDKGTYVENVSNMVVTSSHDIEYLLGEGNKTRTVASTHMNQVSSRSHAVLTIHLHWQEGNRTSKLCMVDLAGSERTELSSGDRLREATSINKSLSALGEVINSLATNVQTPGATFVQYRNSILTRLLKDNLSSPSRLIMLGAISPCCIHHDETLSTLKYVERAKMALIQSQQPNLGEQVPLNDNMAVSQLRLELATLRNQLRIAQQGFKATDDVIPPISPEDEDVSPLSSCMQLSTPHLVNLNQDPRFTERIIHCIEEGITTIGTGDTDLVPDIILYGHDLLPLHAVVQCTNGDISIRPAAKACVFVNGKEIFDATILDHGARIMLGSHHVLRFDRAHQSTNESCIDWNFAHNELLERLLPLNMAKKALEEGSNRAVYQEKMAVPVRDVSTQSDTQETNEQPPNPLKKSSELVLMEASTQCELQLYVLESQDPPDSVRGIQYSICQDQETQIATSTSSVATQYHNDSSIHFDENEKLILERKIAKLRLLLKKKEKQIKRTIPPPPTLDAIAYDPLQNDRLIQIQRILSSILGRPHIDQATLNDSVTAMETQVQDLKLLWNERPTSTKPLAWFLQELSTECREQITLWSRYQSLQLSSAAKVIANLEGRFASLCCTLNEQCAQEKEQFQANFEAQQVRHDQLIEAQGNKTLQMAMMNKEAMEALDTSSSAKLDAAWASHALVQNEWLDKINTLRSSHIQELTTMSVKAALEEDKLKLQMSEWETKCDSLVAEAEIVLCEIRAMNEKTLREQQDDVAIKLNGMEMEHMAQEEKYLQETEEFLRKTSNILNEREAEQTSWAEQKQIDLHSLHLEHEETVQKLTFDHKMNYESMQQQVENLQMSYEDQHANCMLSCARIRIAMADAVETHANTLQAHGNKIQSAKIQHDRDMMLQKEAWEVKLKALDDNATADSVQHARFMKQLVQKHLKEVEQVREEIRELEAALVMHNEEIVKQVEEWKQNLHHLQFDFDLRLCRMQESHAKVLHDLDVDFESQRAQRVQELATFNSIDQARDKIRCQQFRELQEIYAMEIADISSWHSWQLLLKAREQEHLVFSIQDNSLVDEYQLQCEERKQDFDKEVDAMRATFADIEAREVDKHKYANQLHEEEMQILVELAKEAQEGFFMARENLLSTAVENKHILQLQHQIEMDKLHQIHQQKQHAIEFSQNQLLMEQEDSVGRIRRCLETVQFAHTTTCENLKTHHDRILQDYRVAHGQAEERWMQEYEDWSRRQKWVQAQVESENGLIQLKSVDEINLLRAKHKDLQDKATERLHASIETHERWCMSLEETLTRDHLSAEIHIEQEWDQIQSALDEVEREKQALVRNAQQRIHNDNESHRMELRSIQENWTETLSKLHMEREDLISHHQRDVLALNSQNERAISAIEQELAQYERLTASQKRLKLDIRMDIASGATTLSVNQQLFYEESALAIATKWRETEAMFQARASAERDNQDRMFALLEEAHQAQREELHDNNQRIKQRLAEALQAKQGAFEVEKQSALRVLSIQNETWQKSTVDVLEQEYEDACTELRTESAEQEVYFQLQLHDVKESWRKELTQIQMNLEDILGYHMRSIDVMQQSYAKDMESIAQKESEIESRTQLELMEASERQAMSVADKEAFEIRVQAIRYEMASNERERQAEFDHLWQATLEQVLELQSRKSLLRQKCLQELNQLEREFTRDFRAQVHLPSIQSTAKNQLDSNSLPQLRLRIGKQLTIEHASLQAKQLEATSEMLREVSKIQLNNAEMKLHDKESRLVERRCRAQQFLNEPLDIPQVHPLPSDSSKPVHVIQSPSFEQIHLDTTKFPNLVMRPRHIAAKDEAILHQLKQNADLIHRFEAERRQQKSKANETSQTIAKLEASIKSMEEMMRIADEKARDDANVIQLLQEKVKTCIVELPTRDIGPPIVVKCEAPDSPTTRKSNLLRGWK